jgi:hypothetical protein
VRLLFFILLLVNVTVFATFVLRGQAQTPDRPAQPALNPERIRLASEVQPGGISAPSDKRSCWVWSGFKPEQMGPAREALDQLTLGDRLTQPVNTEYWLYIPPLKNKLEAEKKLAELKALTITDGNLLIESGKWRFAISFSAYPSEDAATVRLNQLKEKGVKSAKILKRAAPGDRFLIQQADEKIGAALNQLQTRFGETSLKEVECKAP